MLVSSLVPTVTRIPLFPPQEETVAEAHLELLNWIIEKCGEEAHHFCRQGELPYWYQLFIDGEQVGEACNINNLFLNYPFSLITIFEKKFKALGGVAYPHLQQTAEKVMTKKVRGVESSIIFKVIKYSWIEYPPIIKKKVEKPSIPKDWLEAIRVYERLAGIDYSYARENLEHKSTWEVDYGPSKTVDFDKITNEVVITEYQTATGLIFLKSEIGQIILKAIKGESNTGACNKVIITDNQCVIKNYSEEVIANGSITDLQYGVYESLRSNRYEEIFKSERSFVIIILSDGSDFRLGCGMNNCKASLEDYPFFKRGLYLKPSSRSSAGDPTSMDCDGMWNK